MNSLLRYPGGKSKAVKYILPLIPKEVTKICSPFIGGGSIELACAARGVRVAGYDIFCLLVNFWQILLKDSKLLARFVKVYFPFEKSSFKHYQKSCFSIKNLYEKAAIFFVLNRCSFGGATLSGGFSEGHPRFNWPIIKRLESFKIDGLKVEHADFKESIYSHPNDFLYLDPPYLIKSRLYGVHGSFQKRFDHAGLYKLLNSRKSWILSYNDCEEIRQLYKNYKIIEHSWNYGMNRKKESNEIVILSNDIQC